MANSWVPYTVTLKNEGARDFTGTLVVRPRPTTPPGAPPGFVQPGSGGGTTYEMPMTLAQGAEKRVTIYGQFIDAAMGGTAYEAELVDRSGTSRAMSGPSTVSSSVVAIGVLSDSAQVATQLRDIPRLRFSSTGVVAFTAQTFPNNEAFLGGLTAVVLDNFDTSTLSQAQLHALQQYVGLGGSLILAGGSSWRRTLSPLPAGLLPLRPDATSMVSLSPLMELMKVSTRVEAPSVQGQLGVGARPVLTDRAGHPLIVEANYGSGRVVELTFNPAEEPIASSVGEYRESWAAAVNRAGSGQPTIGKQVVGAMIFLPGVARGGPGRQPADYQLSSLLNDSTASALPPLGLLGLLLIGYILLAGPVNYLLLRRLGRRELMWASVPLVALIATGGAYGAGVIAHGSDYVVNELQLLQLAPDGGGEVTFYDALFSPRRGDLTVQLPDGSLGGTTITNYPQDGGPSSPGSSTAGDRVVVGRSPVVSLREITVWSPRNLKVEATLREPLAIEAHLKLVSGRISGTLQNHGRSGVGNLGLITVDGRVVHFSGALSPGGTVHVDGALETSPGMQGPGMQGMGRGGGPGTVCNPKGCFNTSGRTTARTGAERTTELMQAGADMMFNGNGVVQALVGTSDPLPSVKVGGVAPSRTVTAAFVLPVELESVDTLAAGWAPARIVAASGATGLAGAITVLDFDIPPTSAAGLTLSAGSPAGLQGQPNGQRVVGEIFDWKAGSWSAADLTKKVRISEAQRGPGLVRVRIQGGGVFQNLQIGTDDGSAA